MEPVIFTAIPQDDIQQMVLQKLLQEAKQKKKQQGNREFFIGVASIIIAFIALLLTRSILIAGIAALAGIFSILAGFLYCSQSKDVAPDAYLLKGKTHNARNAAKGNCPICESEIIVYDAVTDHHFQCAVCTGNLHVQNYEVVAR